ncbi:hypothetical protein GIB67_039716, partial [Kingdonia uniflora]
LLTQFKGLPQVGNSSQFTPSSSFTIQQNSFENSGLPDGDKVEEMSEYSQGSTAVGCSQIEFDLPTFVINSQEDKVIDDRNQRGAKLNNCKLSELIDYPFSDECNEIENVFGGTQNLGFIASSCNEFVYASGSANAPSPLGIRQLTMPSINYSTPFNLWESPSREVSTPDASVKNIAEGFISTSFVTKKRQRELLAFKASAKDEENLEEKFRDSTISEERTDNANFLDKFKQGNTACNVPVKVDYDSANPMNLGSVPATNSRLSPLPPEPAGFNYDRGATIDIPLDLSKFMMESQLKMTSYSVLAIVHR